MIKRTRLIDSLGFHWSVHEVTPPADGALKLAEESLTRSLQSSLYFFSRYATKKLSVYPPNWLELPAAELEQLRQKALPVSQPPDVVARVIEQDAAIGVSDERSQVPTSPRVGWLPARPLDANGADARQQPE